MDDLKNKRCCFVGHRKVERTPELEKRLFVEIEKMINSAIEYGIIYRSEAKKYFYVGLNKSAPNDASEDLPFDRNAPDEVPY